MCLLKTLTMNHSTKEIFLLIIKIYIDICCHTVFLITRTLGFDHFIHVCVCPDAIHGRAGKMFNLTGEVAWQQH